MTTENSTIFALEHERIISLYRTLWNLTNEMYFLTAGDLSSEVPEEPQEAGMFMCCFVQTVFIVWMSTCF